MEQQSTPSYSSWSKFFDANAAELQRVRDFVATERSRGTVYPPPADVFAAFKLTPLRSIRVVILGQDPYHGEGQATGLAFSVRAGTALPPTLANIYRELRSDCGAAVLQQREARCLAARQRIDGDLSSWSGRGVLLLNTALTVRAGEAGSHTRAVDGGYHWRGVTDSAVSAVIASTLRPHFILWGRHARETLERATGSPLRRKLRLPSGADVYVGALGDHAFTAQRSPHPSPLSASGGFFGSKPFSVANEALQHSGAAPIDWTLT
jgi:uracil-DNA glycosylase